MPYFVYEIHPMRIVKKVEQFDKFKDVGADYSGRPTPYAPKWTGSASASWTALPYPWLA